MSTPTKEQFLEKFTSEQLAELLVEGYKTAEQATSVAEKNMREVERLNAQLNVINADFNILVSTLRKIKNVFPFGDNGCFDMSKIMGLIQQVQGNNELVNAFGQAMQIVEKYENNTVSVK